MGLRKTVAALQYVSDSLSGYEVTPNSMVERYNQG